VLPGGFSMAKVHDVKQMFAFSRSHNEPKGLGKEHFLGDDSATAGPASVTHNNCEALHRILYGISLPKTTKATTCTITLENLHRARSLIEVIIADSTLNPATPFSTLSTKLDDLASKLDDIKGQPWPSHSENVAITTRVNQDDASAAKPPELYSAVIAAKPSQKPLTTQHPSAMSPQGCTSSLK
jgi:hypothetical protein